jgi:glycosyltransferase involved in cell wall biosynthesis
MILTDSLYSQSRILETFHLRDDKVKVIYPGADHILNVRADPATLEKLGLEPRKYVLAVGSLYPHKNLAILHSINWGEFGLDLCVVGEAPSTNARAFQKVVEESRAQPRNIHYLGRRSDGEIRSLYANAFAYVLPSLYEGFGFPPLEAMYCGCPVIASDRTSIPEVCGEGALYFDALSGESLGRAIAQIVDDPQLRGRMIENGYRRAREFTWDRTAREVMALLEQIQMGG